MGSDNAEVFIRLEQLQIAEAATKNGFTLLEVYSTKSILVRCNTCATPRNVQKDNLVKDKIRCRACERKRYVDAGLARGFSHHGFIGDRNHKYVCLTCRTPKIVQPTQMRSSKEGRTYCDTCRENELVERYREDADKAGLIHHGEDRTKKKYQRYSFKDCGHFFSLQPLQVLKNKDKRTCAECRENRWAAQAEDVGLKLIGAAENSSSERRYQCLNLECNHDFDGRPERLKGCPLCRATNFQDQLEREAVAQDLTLLDKEATPGHRWYQFNECGHERELELSKVRVGWTRCIHCPQPEDRMRGHAVSIGAELLGKGPRQNQRIYRFPCGHEGPYKVETIRGWAEKGKTLQVPDEDCNGCFEDRLYDEAQSQGVEYLGAAPGDEPLGTKRLYRLACGHEAVKDHDKVAKGAFLCMSCQLERFSSEAENVGYEYLERYPAPNYADHKLPEYPKINIKLPKHLYRHREDAGGCGGFSWFHTSTVRSGYFKCTSCQEQVELQPSWLYLVEFIDSSLESVLKFGKAKEPNSRIRQIIGNNPALGSKLIAAFKVSSGYLALAVEYNVHHSSIVSISPVDAQNFGIRNGFTECYPTSSKLDLLAVIEDHLKRVLEQENEHVLKYQITDEAAEGFSESFRLWLEGSHDAS